MLLYYVSTGRTLVGYSTPQRSMAPKGRRHVREHASPEPQTPQAAAPQLAFPSPWSPPLRRHGHVQDRAQVAAEQEAEADRRRELHRARRIAPLRQRLPPPPKS